MALQAIYSRYLVSPSANQLADNASIHYVPSLTSINKPSAILKHNSVQDQLLKKKENFLNVVEGDRCLCVETETVIQFLNGGGAYLPGLDDNFLVDKTIALPIVSSVERQFSPGLSLRQSELSIPLHTADKRPSLTRQSII